VLILVALKLLCALLDDLGLDERGDFGHWTGGLA
jgi:hypothetical protein